MAGFTEAINKLRIFFISKKIRFIHTAVFIFFRFPSSLTGITALTIALCLGEFVRFIIDKNKARLKLILFVLVIGLSYYLAYVK